MTDEMSVEDERAEFERLKARLVALWPLVFPGDDQPYTSVVVPSLTLEPDELAKVPGVNFLEERLLFLLTRLRNPFARLVYVTSQPVDPMVIEYYPQLLVGIPPSQVRARLTLLSVQDGSARPLTEKLLERPRLLARIRAAVRDPACAYLTVFHTTPLERRLAVQLGLPLNANDPDLAELGTRSAGRQILSEAGVAIPKGAGHVRSEPVLLEALRDLRGNDPGLQRAVLKLDHGFPGRAHAVFHYPESLRPDDIRAALGTVSPAAEGIASSDFLARFLAMGGAVEEWIEGHQVSSPSVELRINPLGRVFLTSTHERLRAEASGRIHDGCAFPARSAYRTELQEAGLRVGRVLAQRGVTGRLSIPFIATRSDTETAWRHRALGIDLHMGRTTHPMLVLRFVTSGAYEPSDGLFHGPDGRAKFYVATDSLSSPAYHGLLPADLVDILTLHRLQYDHRSATGVLFHMLGAASEHGRLGVVAIGDSRAHARELYDQAVARLDHETAPQHHEYSR